MFNSKGRMDYTAEINRLFSKTNENDMQSTHILRGTYSQSPIYSTLANRSSSSPDSTSPESYPDLSTSFQRPSSDLYSLRTSGTPLQSYTNPSSIRPQRPIVGRKIFGSTEQSRPSPVNRTSDNEFLIPNLWIDDFTPTNSTLFDPSNQNRSYELFPTEKSTPTKSLTTPNMSPITSKFSPIESNLSLTASNCSPVKSDLSSASTFSPITSNLSTASNFSPITSNLLTASNFSPINSKLSTASNFSMSSEVKDFTPSSPKLIPTYTSSYAMPQQLSEFTPPGYSPEYDQVLAGTSKFDNVASPKMCKFCRRNGETPLVYMTHCVKERIGKKNIVTCPILRSHVCSTCGATGDDAHTITYCPVLRSCNNGKRLESTTVTLKNTRVKSNGKRRY